MSEPVKIRVLIDHAEVIRILNESGESIPMPRGDQNTAYKYFLAFGNTPTLAINQRGFAPEADDNEEQVNGLTLLLIDDPGRLRDAQAEDILMDAMRELLGPPKPGAPEGNKNAQIDSEPADWLLRVRLPSSWEERMRAATYKTGDRGLSAFVRRLIRQELERLG